MKRFNHIEEKEENWYPDSGFGILAAQNSKSVEKKNC